MLLTAAVLAAIPCLKNAPLGRFYTFKCARFARKKRDICECIHSSCNATKKNDEISHFLEGRLQEKLDFYFIIYD